MLDLICKLYLLVSFLLGAALILVMLGSFVLDRIRALLHDAQITIRMKDGAKILMEYKKYRKDFLLWYKNNKK